jgi:hypothetical protein
VLQETQVKIWITEATIELLFKLLMLFSKNVPIEPVEIVTPIFARKG